MANLTVNKTTTPAYSPRWDPFSVFRDFVRWDPFREIAPITTTERLAQFDAAFEVKETYALHEEAAFSPRFGRPML